MTPGLLLAAALGAAAAPSFVEARCDPRVDLLGVVQALAGRRDAGPPLPPSMRDVATRFAAWKEHPAVRTYGRAAAEREGAPGCVLALSALSDPPALDWVRPRKDVSGDFIAACVGEEAHEGFLRDLRDFARRSGVMAWLKARAGECREAERSARRELGGRDPVAEVEAYLGKELDAKVLLALSLVYTPGRYTAYILPYPYSRGGSPVRGPFAVYVVLEPDWREGGRPRFRLDEPFGSGAFAETLYIAVEPAYARYRGAFEARAGLAARMDSSCPPGWQNCSLHIVAQALLSRLARRRGELTGSGPGPTDAAIARLADVLKKDYEPGRVEGRYKSIDDFWPRLIEALGPAGAR